MSVGTVGSVGKYHRPQPCTLLDDVLRMDFVVTFLYEALRPPISIL